VIKEEEIIDVLKCLKLGKASGVDTISHHMLKNTCNSVCKSLKLLFDMSLRSCKFPKMWKSALVMPLFKKKERHLASNCRPISLLSSVRKV